MDKDAIALFEVLLAAVGAQSVDDLSDIFVTGPFTQSEALAKEEAERVKTISDLWSRLGYIGILPNLGIQELNLTPEKRKQLLDFEENLLKATALTDEFAGFGREEDALLLGEMTQLARVYAALDPQLEDSTGTGSTGGTGSTPPAEGLDALMLVSGESHLVADNAAIKARLEQLGYTVTTQSSNSFQREDADGMELIVGTGYNGPNKSEVDGLDVPVVIINQRLLDEFDLVAEPTATVGSFEPVLGTTAHPIAEGIAPGALSLYTDTLSPAAAQVGLITPGASATNIATVTLGYGGQFSTIFAHEQGDTLFNGQIADARRVAFIGQMSEIANLNDTGWQLFDNAVEWAIGEEEQSIVEEPFVFWLDTFWRAKNDSDLQKGIEKINELYTLAWSDQGFTRYTDTLEDIFRVTSQSYDSGADSLTDLSLIKDLAISAEAFAIAQLDVEEVFIAIQQENFNLEALNHYRDFISQGL